MRDRYARLKIYLSGKGTFLKGILNAHFSGCAADVTDQGLFAYEYILSDPIQYSSKSALTFPEASAFGGLVRHGFKPWAELTSLTKRKETRFRKYVFGDLNECCECSQAAVLFGVYEWAFKEGLVPQRCRPIFSEYKQAVQTILGPGISSFRTCDSLS